MTTSSSDATGEGRGRPVAGRGPFVVLASRSPQRELILRQLGLPFRVSPSRHDESHVHGDPVTTVVDNAVGKAREVAAREAGGPTTDDAVVGRPQVGERGRPSGAAVPDALVLGVDTVVVLDGHILGKAATADDAASYVGRLAGRTHDVYSGLCLIGPGGREWAGHARTAVTFRALAPETVASYVATGEWRERAGAYAIQGIGSALVAAVEGDYWNVVGLPVAVLLDGLGAFGVAPFSWLAPHAGGSAAHR